MRRAIGTALGLLAVAALGFWALTRPNPLTAEDLSGLEADPEAGARIFAAAGCASCHTAPDAEDADGAPVLAGGKRFESPFGTFVAPNISTDEDHGIGAWSDAEIVSAIQRGLSPQGAHYYPAFPYSAYGLAETGDILSLVAHLRTLPASDRPSEEHEVGFPFSVRRGVGLWKMLFLQDNWTLEGDDVPADGRYLVEALGHCAECHTPRNAAGGLDRSRWMAGAENPSGEGRIPGLTPAQLDWSDGDIAAFLSSGFTPDFDTAGGEMAQVIEELATLPEADHAAIAAYLKALPEAE